jgi:O-antigen ligase
VQILPYQTTSPPLPGALARTPQPFPTQAGFHAFVLLLFVVHSRVTETLARLTGANLRIAAILLAVSLAGILLSGKFVKRVVNPMGIALILLTGWFLACVPTSVHKGGSVKNLLSFWIPTVLLSLCAMAYPENSKTLRRMLYAVVAGTLLVAFVRERETVFSIGALGNPNLYGQHLLYALPLVLLPVFRHGLISLRGMAACFCWMLLVVKVIFTGSRSALLAAFVVGAFMLLQLPLSRKMLLLALTIPLALVILLTLPQAAKDRYETIWSPEMEAYISEGEQMSAIQSAQARKHHFKQSVELTFKNPIFGVGPGMFTVASAEESNRRGERASWRETHNSFTQISSETGLLGLVLYLAVIGVTVSSLRRTMRTAKRAQPGTEASELGQIATVLLYSLVSMLITGAFSSSAYLPYFPLLGCFAFAAARLISSAPPAPVPQPAAAQLPWRPPVPAKPLRPPPFPPLGPTLRR